MTIEHRMDGALGGDGDPGKSAEEALANLAGTPAAMLAHHCGLDSINTSWTCWSRILQT